MPITLELWQSPAVVHQKGRCYVAPDILRKLGAVENDVLEIKRHRGRKVLARIGQALLEDKRKSSIRLDRYLRQALKASMGEGLQVEKAEPVSVKKAFLSPLTPVTGNEDEIRSYLHRSPAAEALPLSEGVFFHNSAGRYERNPLQGGLFRNWARDLSAH
ncbi:MAG: hypothetical protein JSW12_11080 [Deltaproteobacteria bacterium]|nr:MAG: hypothetical protein JSW12_11080 [Deltaproteobacteria bacterium]